MEFDIRNTIHNLSGGIDCEIKHPELGWIPFTAHPDDPEDYGVKLYYEAKLLIGSIKEVDAD